jgi:SAM-dependent methyltransferase
MSWLEAHAAAWDAQYSDGRYVGDPPEPFVAEILTAADRLGLSRGLYVGCGNGRNILHLIDEGLDLRGIDISHEAIRQLRAARPELSARFSVGAIDSLASAETFQIVVGIQVFMFGTREQAHRHLNEAKRRVEPGGLLCLRANAVGTDVWPSHHVSERHDDGSFTVVYESGPKAGLSVHFFSRVELEDLFVGWEPVFGPEVDSRKRNTGPGQWSQFEAIWRRQHPGPRGSCGW